MSKKYPCPAGREPDCGYPACAHDRQCELAALTCSGYAPEFVTIRKDWIYYAQESLRLGIEAMQELLAHHDQSIGRDRARGKREAEQMERDIAEAETRLQLLNDFKFSHSQNDQSDRLPD